jgi:hypothetical protein
MLFLAVRVRLILVKNLNAAAALVLTSLDRGTR